MSDKEKEFNEALTAIVELANVSGNRLTKEQIAMYFKDFTEGNKEKYGFLYSYLTGLGIEIEGEEKPVKNNESVGKTETEEAKAFYNMYVEDVKALDREEGEKEELLKMLVKGEKEAAHRLTQLYLTNIMEIAEEYISSPLGRADLVAEGNLALFEGILEYDGSENIREFEEHIFGRIRREIEKAVYEEMGSGRISKHLADRVNALNDASTELAKELGREASLKELSERLALSEEEIKELMKVSIDALTADEG
ncbi:MAG: sigma-70 domain-containing protein [Lachnospiraceae bacterium]